MAKQRVLNTRFWSDNWVTDLNPLDRYLFIYLLTNEHTELCGIYELPWRTMSNETGLEIEMLKKMFKRLVGKAYYIEGWVYLKNYQKHHVYTDDCKKGVERGLLSVPAAVLEKIRLIDSATPLPPPCSPVH